MPGLISSSVSASIKLLSLSIFRTFTFMWSGAIRFWATASAMSLIRFMFTFVFLFSFFRPRSTFFAWPRSLTRIPLSGLLFYFLAFLLFLLFGRWFRTVSKTFIWLFLVNLFLFNFDRLFSHLFNIYKSFIITE